MGIYSRDYIREPSPSGPWRRASGSGQWAIKFLLIANIAVFLLQALTGQVVGAPGHSPMFVGGVTDWFVLDVSHLYSFQIWRLLTYGFCHSPEILHIAVNLFVLWMFGRAVEPIYGSREFLAFYLAGVIVSGLCHVLIQLPQPAAQQAGVVGASGGVMAVVFLTAMHYPQMQVLVMFVLPMPLWLLAVLYAAGDLMGFFGGGGSVAHAAHLGGAAFGVAYHYFQWSVLGWLGRLRLPRFRRLQRVVGPRRNIRIYQPSEPSQDDLEQRVDAILQKIHDHGEASLTDSERETLKAASSRYKSKNR